MTEQTKTFVSAREGGRRVGDPPKSDVPEEVALAWKRDNVERELDRLLDLTVPEVGRDLMRAAELDLRERGIRLEAATQAQLAAALSRVSP
jgi:hypothetical protein